MLDAVRALAFTVDKNVRRAVDYRNLGTEELGSIYESLLELHPVINGKEASFQLSTASGHERKTTGSYYTPASLISCLLDSALEPVLDEVARKPDPETVILNLKVCDPACGSGHFLIAAAHRIAKRLATVRTGDEEPSPDALRKALRDVIGHCLYGVDINPMAVELCKVSLWMEALEPGKPLSFLEHKIQCGNSLLGATPALLEKGIPDDAFKPIEGDDKKLCTSYRKLNKDERQGQQDIFARFEEPWDRLGDLATSILNLEKIEDDTIQGICQKQQRYAELVRSAGYLYGRLWADAWCAAFVWKKVNDRNLPYAVTEQIFRQIEKSPYAVPHWMRDEIQRLSTQYQFFHWHLAFPDVFRVPASGERPDNEQTGWCGGFDVVLGNPPWIRQETLKPIKKLLPTFRSFTSTADSSVYFLELSVLTCRHLGHVGLLTPNKWFRASYSEYLRKFLRERCRVELLIDFGHSRNLFPDADTFPAAVVLQVVDLPVQDSEKTRFVQAHDLDRERYSLTELISSRAVAVPHRNLRPDRWHLEDAGPYDLLDRLMATGLPLENLLARPALSGLKTGFNEAFYVQTSLREDMLKTDSRAESLFRKLVRGRDIRRWMPQWADLWHIVIPSSQNCAWPWSNATSEADAESVFAVTYPSVYWHLKRFEERLRTRQDKGVHWWELRACDYYGDFEKPKIIVQCIAYYSQFSFDDEGHYINNKAIAIPTDDL
ncbi:MAG: N-6 DNA methylase, partial [Deltaproteobacteria bacterium]|nr:N-6 DNA methylase [Deltaproteobacteria bacterium]